MKNNRDKDIVFVNPPLSQEERYGVKFKAGGQTPPTGLAILAAVCREKGYSVGLIDAPVLDLTSKEVIKQLIEMKTQYVGLTASTISIFNALELAKRIRSEAPNMKIILGGPHITAAPQETVERLGMFFDVAVIGEGELTLPELIAAIDENKPLSKVKGIAYPSPDRKRLVLTAPREIIKNLDSLPFPAWDLLPNLAEHYVPPAHTVKRFPATLLVPSRGCPNQCIFCDRSVFGNKMRSYSADYIIRMIKHLQKNYGIKEIQFRDDNLLVFKAMLTELCQKLIEQKINIVWSACGRVDIVTPEYLALLKRAGCWQLWFGIESGSDRILNVIKKKTNRKMIMDAITNTKKAGISPCGFFMIGMPTETEENIKETIDLLLELPLDDFHMSHLTPFPGSELYDIASQYGYFDNDWKKMNGWKTIFLPRGLSHENLVYYSNFAFKRFYFRPRIIFNYILKMRSFRAFKVYLTAFLGFLKFTSMKERK